MKKSIFLVLSLVIIITLISSNKEPYDQYKGRNLELKSENKALFWFSGIHSNNPDHEMFDDIKEAFTKFEADYVLVEGDYDDAKYKNIDDSFQVRLHGESAYVTYLSKTDNIPVSSIEPLIGEQLKFLQKKYKSSDILAMFMLRQINQMQRETKNKSIDFFNYMEKFVSKYQFKNKIEMVDRNKIIKLLEPYIGFKVTSKNWKSINAYGIVYKETGTINSIYTDILAFRDDYSIKLIKEKLNEYDRLFIMMGADHIKVQRDALEKYFEEL
jgi:hypothetical protein